MFALGTALGDLTAITLKVGYFSPAVLFLILVGVPLAGNWKPGMNPVFAVGSMAVTGADMTAGRQARCARYRARAGTGQDRPAEPGNNPAENGKCPDSYSLLRLRPNV